MHKVNYSTIADLSKKFEKEASDGARKTRILNQGWVIHQAFEQNPKLSYKQIAKKYFSDKNGKPLDKGSVWYIYDQFLKIMQEEGFDATVR
jgi:maltoporin